MQWIIGELQKNRVIIRGYVRKDKPLICVLHVNAVLDRADGNGKYLAYFGYVCDNSGCSINERDDYGKPSWQEDMSSTLSHWRARDPLYMAKRQVVVKDYDNERATVLGLGDPRLIFHLGGLYVALQSIPGDNTARDEVARRLQALLASNFDKIGEILTLK